MPVSAHPLDGVASRPIQHIGYVVDDIEAAVQRWVSTFGAGPFFWIVKETSVPDARYYGEPCVLEHSAVIGAWGDTFVELTELHEVSPVGLRDALVGSATDDRHLNHICYAVEDPEQEVARLEALGLQRFWHASMGPLDVSYCDGRSSFGHAIEIHKRGPEFIALFDAIAAAAKHWDGDDPLRELQPPH